LCGQGVHRSLSARFIDGMSIGPPMATLLDQFVDLTLAEDSLGMVVHGPPTTVGVTDGIAWLRGDARIEPRPSGRRSALWEL
jgi:hypothetical protein